MPALDDLVLPQARGWLQRTTETWLAETFVFSRLPDDTPLPFGNDRVYVKRSRRQGLGDLRRLARDYKEEVSWVYVPDYSLWINTTDEQKYDMNGVGEENTVLRRSIDCTSLSCSSCSYHTHTAQSAQDAETRMIEIARSCDVDFAQNPEIEERVRQACKLHSALPSDIDLSLAMAVLDSVCAVPVVPYDTIVSTLGLTEIRYKKPVESFFLVDEDPAIGAHRFRAAVDNDMNFNFWEPAFAESSTQNYNRAIMNCCRKYNAHAKALSLSFVPWR